MPLILNVHVTVVIFYNEIRQIKKDLSLTYGSTVVWMHKHTLSIYLHLILLMLELITKGILWVLFDENVVKDKDYFVI